jgi:hypothetical protein
MHEAKIKRVWVTWGFMKAFSLGIHISYFQFSLDLVVFYIQLEFPVSKRRMAKYAKKSAE